MRSAILGTLLVLVALGRAGAQDRLDVVDKQDDFTGSHTILTKKFSKLDGVKHGRLVMQLQQFNAKDSAATYGLFITYLGSDWMFIDAGEPLRLLVDAEHMELSSPMKRPETQVGLGGVIEVMYYDVTPAQLHQLAAAQQIRVQVSGKGFTQEGRFSDENMRILRAFVTKYVP